MLQLSPQQNIFIANTFVDFRKGIDGLAASVRDQFQLDPFSGAIFVFYNRHRTTIKILTFDGQGFWLHTKRLSQGKFKYNLTTTNPYLTVCHRSLYILIHNGDPKAADISKNWQPIKQIFPISPKTQCQSHLKKQSRIFPEKSHVSSDF